MPRMLPWLSEAPSTSRSASAIASASATAVPRKRSAPSGHVVDSDLDDLQGPAKKRHASKQPGHCREPSSSPPPAAPQPPPVEFMNDGYTADDIFHMVEDEFYSTAQLFTRHIHAAEYARLRKLHRSRGRATLAQLARGTDGRTVPSRQLQMKMERADGGNTEREMVRQLAFGHSDGEDDEDEDDEEEWAAEPELKGLLTGSEQSPYKAARRRDLVPHTGHSIGESNRTSPIKEEAENDDEDETDEDDLDAKPFKPTQSSNVASASRPAALLRAIKQQHETKSSLSKQFTKNEDHERQRIKAAAPSSGRRPSVREKMQSTTRRGWSSSDESESKERRSTSASVRDGLHRKMVDERMKGACRPSPVRKQNKFDLCSETRAPAPTRTSPSPPLTNTNSHASCTTTSRGGKGSKALELIAQRRRAREQKMAEEERRAAAEEDGTLTFPS